MTVVSNDFTDDVLIKCYHNYDVIISERYQNLKLDKN